MRFSINVTLDGCIDHRLMLADEELHAHAADNLRSADALLFGRVTYTMMEEFFRPFAREGTGWMLPFARTIDAAKKYVVSSTLPEGDPRLAWNAQLVVGDLETAVRQLKQTHALFVGGSKLALSLADAGLIDEYEFIVHPVVTGHGPTLFAGLRERLVLKLVSRREFRSGAVVLRYQPGAP
jgi:dihydrofolate reductase